MNNILSISIPTYKRPDLLRKNLESIISSILYSGEQLPIYIYDDSLSNINEEVISDAKKEYKHIFHIKNESNLGIDKNIKKAASQPDSKFVWPIGEDDLMCKNAVSIILNIIDNNEFDFLAANYVYVNNEHDKILSNPLFDFSGKVESISFCEQEIWKIGFIGACIVNRRKFISNSDKETVGTYFNHVGTILKMLSDSDYVFVTDEVLVLNRAADESSFTWTDQSFEVFFGWNKMLRMVEDRFSDDSFKKMVHSSKKLFNPTSTKWLMSKKAEGLLNKSLIEEYYSHSYFLKMKARFINLIPKYLLKKLKASFQRIKRGSVKRDIPNDWL